MKWLKRKYLLAVVGVMALIVLTFLGVAFLGEPRFEGRALSRWLDDPGLSEPEIRRAVRAIGTNAIPYLQKWLMEDASWLETGVRTLNARQEWYLFDYAPSIDANIRAMRGFLYLGELAEPAIPWLVSGMNKKDNDFMFYAKALVSSGPKGREALMKVYPKVSFNEKAQIVQAVYQYIRDKPELARFFVQFIDDADPNIGINAMFCVRQLKGRCPRALYGAIARIAEDDGATNRSAAQIIVRDLIRLQPDLQIAR